MCGRALGSVEVVLYILFGGNRKYIIKVAVLYDAVKGGGALYVWHWDAFFCIIRPLYAHYKKCSNNSWDYGNFKVEQYSST